MKHLTTIPRLLLDRLKKRANFFAAGYFESGEVKNIAFEEYGREISYVTLACNSLGLERGDRVTILASTSLEWNMADLSVLCAGGATVPIYTTFTPEETAYLINHSRPTGLFIETDDQLKKILESKESLEGLKFIVSFEKLRQESIEKLPETITLKTWEEVKELGSEIKKEQPAMFREICYAVNEGDLASIIYTSGTTGHPKGAMITHKAFMKMFMNVYDTFKGLINEQDRFLTFLPLSHVFGRCDSFMNLVFGSQNIYARSLPQLFDDMAVAKPTVMMAVPRIFEKLYNSIHEDFNERPLVQKSLVQWAITASQKYFDKIDEDKSPTTTEIVQREMAYNLVFKKIYDNLGGEVRFLISGGAPLSSDIVTFLRHINLTVLEGYGLTETVAPCCVNPPIKQIPGTVGLPMGDVKIGFSEDKEILIKTEALFSGYYHDEEATKKAFEDGWFKTGDLGELNQDGYLMITDRKKDIIITSGGKNIAPQKIENSLKLQPHIAYSMVIGDGRKFVSALVAIDKNDFLSQLESMNLKINCEHQELAEHPKTYEFIQSEIDAVNKKLPRYEQIKKFVILTRPFTVESGLITPSLKIKRETLAQEFQNEIDAMYQD